MKGNIDLQDTKQMFTLWVYFILRGFYSHFWNMSSYVRDFDFLILGFIKEIAKEYPNQVWLESNIGHVIKPCCHVNVSGSENNIHIFKYYQGKSNFHQVATLGIMTKDFGKL